MRRRGAPPRPNDSSWWQHAVCYQVFVRSFADSDGDGVGDLEGVRDRLGYLELLGVDAVALSPFYLSPNVADGYDIAGPRAVDPVLGGIDAFERLAGDLHRRGLRILLDVAPGHTSDRHSWFLDALVAAPTVPQRLRYHFREGSGTAGELPPNDWLDADGASAWSRADDGQWYLHLLGPGRPDLNWADPTVRADFERTLRFWLDRGADGFRLIAAHALSRSTEPADTVVGGTSPPLDRDGVHEALRAIRALLDRYPGAMAIGEVGSRGWHAALGRLLPPNQLHLATDRRFASAPFDADAVQATISSTLAASAATATTPAWTLTTHDGTRPVSRYGGGQRGRDRARAMALVQLGLPGTACVFNGDELGLPDGEQGPRSPVAWQGSEPPFGFSAPPGTWVPMPRDWAGLTVESQLERPDSTLSLYRRALELRRTHPAGTGEELEWYGAPPGCFAYRRPGGLVCALNTSAAPIPLPDGEVLLSSAPLTEGKLPANAAAWLIAARRR
ncbi:alpha-glucosidase [Saccharomonospora amisosensis]|uniref:Alpha-glucosidase n=1 Tax=Saccharomonospora amisosensis TaxID=1128677 RepID=A0A7X5USE6_9PSEU|nr:alpha-amylase family glycosyl hydrolase [Saccharomonospora amisosensis]NIJ13325.1 alpha-glucosidase [Saccharomonospora amisosensis]